MASAGLLLLLLMSSSFILSSLSNQLSPVRQHEHALQKRGEKMQKAREYFKKINSILGPIIGLIPKAGPYLTALLKLTEIILDDGDPIESLIKTKFDELNVKIDNYHVEMKWETWATIYHGYETKIKAAWNDYQQLKEDCKNNPKEKQKYRDLFKEEYKASVLSAIKELHSTLTAGKLSFTTGFGKLLTDNVRCHEKSIIQYTLLINDLFNKGITVGNFYYRLNGVNKADELAKMSLEAALVMSDIHKHCIDNPDQYVIKDVLDLIDGSMDRTELAKDVHAFLKKEYDRYDWIAVAFITTHSKHEGRISKKFNKHFLGGFIEASKGDVSVAVAKQLKGKHTKAARVIEVIKECVTKDTQCHEVIKKLQICGAKDIKDVNATFTAVHAYIDKSHDSTANKASEDDEYIDTDDQSSTKYVYTGMCKKHIGIHAGYYRVMIKSDEELSKG